MAVPLHEEPEPAPEPEVWCRGGGQLPAGTKGTGVRFIYGGGCGTCGQQVTVDENFRIRPHHTLGFIHGSP